MRLRRKVRPDARQLRLVLDRLARRLRKFSPEIRDLVVMAAWELLENGVKYHIRCGLRAGVWLEIVVGSSIRISVTNHLANPTDAAELMQGIDHIRSSLQARKLYYRRLEQILNRRVKGESKLGLLKLSCEGDFDLDYRHSDDRLTVIALKDMSVRGVKAMNPLIFEDLAIDIVESDPIVTVVWKGRSRSLSPEKVLDGYLETLRDKVQTRKVIVDFTHLEAMNSSTVPPILTFIKGLEDGRIPAYVVYNDAEHWQKASFMPISVLISSYNWVKIKGKSQVSGPFSNLFAS